LELSALREEIRQLRDRNLDGATFEERADIIARMGVKVWPSEDLKTMRVKCRLPMDDRPVGIYPPQPPPDVSDTALARIGSEPEPECEKVPPTPPDRTIGRTSTTFRFCLPAERIGTVYRSMA
jgi:hypothetical protein